MMDIKSVMVEEEEMTPSKVNEYAKPSLPSPPSLLLSIYPTNLPFLIIPRPLSLSLSLFASLSLSHSLTLTPPFLPLIYSPSYPLD